VYFKQREYDKAIPDFDKVIALTPNSAKAYAGRGMCYSRNNRFKAAITDLTQALRLNPGFPRDLKGVIHGHLGKSLLAEGSLQQAKHHSLIACKLGNQGSCKALQSPRLKNLK
jgi:tetratricopeptide (TPR) repeat protein